MGKNKNKKNPLPGSASTFSPKSAGSSSYTNTFSTGNSSTPAPTGSFPGTLGACQEEFDLLSLTSTESNERSRHENRTSPLMTRGAMLTAGLTGNDAQYGVLGRILTINSKDRSDPPEDPRLYLNTNAPFSALVCGVQGSGKSHTVSAMLESMFITDDPRIGSLSKPLCGLVLHFSDGGTESNPSEAAWLAVPRSPMTKAPPVRVYVSPSSLQRMRAIYSPLGPNVTVEPFHLTKEELDAEAFLSMMAIGSSESTPLYVQIVLSILRELGEKYTYFDFQRQLDEKKKDFNPAQRAGLKQRMALLESFFDKAGKVSRKSSRFVPGQITIVDLSDPFIDSPSACGIFEIITRLFVRAQVGTGKVLLVDEAHKYLTPDAGSSGLTKALLTLIREQRHKAMRVILSTQEPTIVPPVLLDLCTVIILHRFSSPSWWDHVVRHVSADISSGDAFDRVVKLKTGEAIIFAPSGLCMFKTVSQPPGTTAAIRRLGEFGRLYLHVRTRMRVTKDGGASVMVLC